MKKNKRLASAEHFSFSLETKKNLGQNFLADQSILAQIVARAERHAEKSGRACIEIGPGSGALTRKLLEADWTVYAIEKDARAVAGLAQTLGQEFTGKFFVFEDDVLRSTLPQQLSAQGQTPLCIGNIPYYITSDILFWFLNQQKYFSAAILMVQKEVAERLAAKPSNKDYGRLTVRTQLSCQVEQVLVAPARAFVPPPKVDSAVVELLPHAQPFMSDSESESFGHFTASLFSARRKMLRKTLLHLAHELKGKEISNETATGLEQSAEKLWGVSFNQRPEELSPEVLLGLFRLIKGLP